MSKHQDVRSSLYDYLEGALDEKQRTSIEEHLHACHACTEALRRLREALALVERPEVPASDARSEEFWGRFAAAVEQQIQQRGEKSTRLADAWDVVRSYLFFHRGSLALAGMAAAMVLLVIVLVNRPVPTREIVFIDSSSTKSIPLEHRNETALRTSEEQPRSSDNLTQPKYAVSPMETPLRVRYADNRMSQYLRKSKVLLIGIANLKTDETQPVDLSVEQRASRELIREARYLKQRPLNPRVDQLVDALSRILIELANITEEKQVPNMELVRSGIHQENLLFKIRMAEAVYDSAQLVYAKGKQQ